MNKSNYTQRERIITGLILAPALLGGCALGGGNGHDASGDKPRIVTLPTTPNTKSSPTAPSSPQQQPEMQAPQDPIGGDYDTAAAATLAVITDFNPKDAEAKLAAIKNPEIKNQASMAVQEAVGALAITDVVGGDDIPRAEALIGTITDPDIRTEASTDMSVAVAAIAGSKALGGSPTGVAEARKLESIINTPRLIGQVEQLIGDEQSQHSIGAQEIDFELNQLALNQANVINKRANEYYEQLNRHTTTYRAAYGPVK